MTAVYFTGDTMALFDDATEIAQVLSGDGPETSVEVRELPPYLGQTVKEKRVIQLVDGGEYTFSLLDDGSNAKGLKAKVGNPDSGPFTLKDGTSSLVSFDAWVTNVKTGGAEHSNELTADVTLTLDGTATYT
jgi:hypothetical protein